MRAKWLSSLCSDRDKVEVSEVTIFVDFLKFSLFSCFARFFSWSMAVGCTYCIHNCETPGQGLSALEWKCCHAIGSLLISCKKPFGLPNGCKFCSGQSLLMRLLAWLCLAFLLIAALLQLKPCLPNQSTVVLPHIQGCILSLSDYNGKIQPNLKSKSKFSQPSVAKTKSNSIFINKIESLN